MLSRVNVWHINRRPTYYELKNLIDECVDYDTMAILYYETENLGRMRLVINKDSNFESLYNTICIKEGN